MQLLVPAPGLERCAPLPSQSCPMSNPATSAPRQARPGPGSASSGKAYSGSRRDAQRFEYSAHSPAGFVELAPSSFGANSWNDKEAAGREFHDVLSRVTGVVQARDVR